MTFVELFFDLVFVFAITSVTQLVLHDLDWAGVGKGLLILWLVWWAWTQFTWTLNPADTNHVGVRLVTLAATAVAFFMAQAIPDAYDSAGAWFAFAYIGVRVLGLGLQLAQQSGVRDDVPTLLAWVSGSAFGLVAVAIGGLVESEARVIFWAVAVALDLVAAGRAGRGSWTLNAAHFAERHGLIVIIALGESLIAAGVALAALDRDFEFFVGTASAVVLACAAWWIYFALAKERLEEFLEAQPSGGSGTVGRDVYSWGHLPIIAGIISFAVAAEQILTHLDEELSTEALLALSFGVVLYLGGIAAGLWRSGERGVAPWAVAAAVAVGAAIAGSAVTSPLVSLAAVAAVLVAFAVWGQRSQRLLHQVS